MVIVCRSPIEIALDNLQAVYDYIEAISYSRQDAIVMQVCIDHLNRRATALRITADSLTESMEESYEWREKVSKLVMRVRYGV